MTQARDRIAFERVSMEFPTAAGPLRVVEDVSYRIRDGEFVSVIGPSGCGKTTTMNLVAGFVKPTKGSVLLDDAPVTGPGPDRGVIFQEYGVFPWLTVRQNIAFGLNLRASRVPQDGAQRDLRPLYAPHGPRRFRGRMAEDACPAACASGWRSRVPTPCGRSSCSWTSRSALSMRKRAAPCRTC